jgi:hypothetical protein
LHSCSSFRRTVSLDQISKEADEDRKPDPSSSWSVCLKSGLGSPRSTSAWGRIRSCRDIAGRHRSRVPWVSDKLSKLHQEVTPSDPWARQTARLAISWPLTVSSARQDEAQGSETHLSRARSEVRPLWNRQSHRLPISKRMPL